MGKHSKTKQNKNNIKLLKILSSILFIIFIICMFYFIQNILHSMQNKKIYEQMSTNNEINPNIETKNEITENMQKVISLKNENEDVKGWIQIDNTIINYPLLQTTDNEYYLTHNYKKEKSKYGSIYLKNECDLEDNNSNIIIYGHNLKDEQMFNTLLKYEDESFYNEHKTIKIATENEECTYSIISVFKSRIFYQDETNVFRYYNYIKFENENKYNEYVSNCKKEQLYDTKISAKYGEQLITLITCEYSQENGRIVVVAKKES